MHASEQISVCEDPALEMSDNDAPCPDVTIHGAAPVPFDPRSTGLSGVSGRRLDQL